MVYGGAVAGALVTLVLLYLVARRSNLARWILAACGVWVLISGLGAVGAIFDFSPAVGWATLLVHAVALAGMVMLFLPPSNAWMRARNKNRQ